MLEIPAGEAGTDATVDKMMSMVQDVTRRPELRLFAIDVLTKSGVDTRDPFAVGTALFNWVQEYIRYIPDPVNIETIQDPEATLNVGAGDCDDHAALMAGLAMSVGIPARFHVAGFDADNFQHVYAELLINGQWIPADTTESTRFGEPPMQTPENKLYTFDQPRAYLNDCSSCRSPRNVGMSGFLSDIWDDLRADVKEILNSGDVDISLQLPDQIIKIETPVTEGAGRAAVQEFFSNPWTILLAGGTLFALTRTGSSRRGGRTRARKGAGW